MCKTTSNFIYAQLLLLGEGIPDPGDIFKVGSELFQGVVGQIGLAIPGTEWIGKAADAYLNQNTAQELRAKVMGEIDDLTGNLISNQAEHVSNVRSVLRAMKSMIDGVYKACKWLEDNLWFVGDAVSVVMAIPACALAMAVSGGALLVLTIMTAMNAFAMIGLGGRLLDILKNLPNLIGMIPGIIEDIIDGIVDGIWPPKFPDFPFPGLPNIPGLPEFTWPPVPGIPDFNLPIPGLPEFQWPSIPGLPDFGGLIPDFGGGLIPGFPNLPGLPGVPDLFPGLPGLGALLPGVGNLGQLPTWNELAALPDFLGGFAGMPSLGFGSMLNFAQLPGVSSITSTMGQLQQLMGAGGGPGQMGSMAGEQAQMISSQAQQGAGQDDKQRENEGAGAGTAGAERAPVDAGSGGQQGRPGTVL
jgi:hypothetical protein